MDNLQINVIEKKVAKDACWTTINEIPVSDSNECINVVKVMFDRSYPYFWLHSKNLFSVGAAVSLEAIKDAVVINTDSGGVDYAEVNLFSDGILPLDYNSPTCIALGPRSSFFICTLVGSRPEGTSRHGESVNPVLRISAQDVPVNPFGAQTGP